MPALPDLTTLANVKAYAQVTGTADDALLTRLVKVKSSEFRTETGRDFSLATYAETRDGSPDRVAGSSYDGLSLYGFPVAPRPGRATLLLRHYPVISIASLAVADPYTGLSTSIPVNPTGILPAPYAYFEPETGKLQLVGGVFPAGYQNISVGYQAGYAVAPDEIEQAVIEMVAWAYKGRDRLGQTGKTVGGEMITFSGKLRPDSAQAVIDRYTRPEHDPIRGNSVLVSIP